MNPTELKNVKIKYVSILTDEKQPSNGEKVIFKDSDNSITIPAKIEKFDKAKGLLYVTPMIALKADTENEFYVNETIEKAAHEFMKDGIIGRVDKNHDFVPDNDVFVVESYVDRSEDIYKFRQVFDINENEELMTKADAGEITGVSIAGTAEKVVEQSTEKSDNIAKNLVNSIVEAVANIGKSKEPIQIQKDFNSQYTADIVREMSWSLTDSISKIFNNDDIKDKVSAILADIEQYKKAITALQNAPEEDVTKEIKNNDYKEICKILKLNKSGEDEMKEEDVKKMVDEAVEPLKTKIEELEKSNSTKEDELKALKKEKEALDKKVEELEKETSGSQQDDDEPKPMKKEEKRIWT